MIENELRLSGEKALMLLFGEVNIFYKAKRNILTSRYVCTQVEAATIGALLLQMKQGDYDPQTCLPGYLCDEEKLDLLLPAWFGNRMRAGTWEELITIKYKALAGMTKLRSVEEYHLAD